MNGGSHWPPSIEVPKRKTNKSRRLTVTGQVGDVLFFEFYLV